MCVGDSNTEGVDGLGGYRTPLGANAPALSFVGSQFWLGAHEGHSGLTIEQISANVLPAIDTQNPELVLLMAGTNNIGLGQSGATALKAIVAFAEALIAKPSVEKVIVATIPPRTTATAEAVAFNDGLAAAFAGASEGITTYDVNRDVELSDLIDSVHPSTAGYAIIADGWARALDAAGVPAVELDPNGPQIAVGLAGDAVAVWTRNGAVWARRLVDGSWSPAVELSVGATGAGRPQVAIDAVGNAMVVWDALADDGTSRVWASRNVRGEAWSPPVPLSSGGNATDPRLAIDGSGHAHAVWSQSATTGADADHRIWASAFR